MKILTVAKVHTIIELAETLRLSNAVKSTNTLAHHDEQMLDFLQECQNPESPRYKLHDYINKLSSEELAEAVALMLLGRGHSD